MDDHPFSDLAALAQGHVRIEKRVRADPRAGAHEASGLNDRARAHRGALLQDHVRPDGGGSVDRRVLGDDRGRMDALDGPLLISLEEPDGLQEGEVRVRVLDQRLRNAPVILRDDDRRRLGAREVRLVLGIGQEREVPFLGLANARDPRDLYGSVSDDGAVDGLGDRIQRDLHPRLSIGDECDGRRVDASG